MRVAVWIQTRPNFFVGPDLGPNCFQTSSADDTSKFPFPLVFAFHVCLNRESSGSVVECLTRDRRVLGSSLTGVTVLCP